MKSLLAAAILLALRSPVSAHRLDEYLQATLLSVERDRIRAQIRLAPGIAIVPAVLAAIDTDSDGRLSAAEQNAYALRVLRDLSLTVDRDTLRLALVSARFPSLNDMREGLGEILLETRAALPPGNRRRVVDFANRHQPAISVYLVNSLVPPDPAIRIESQQRSEDQSVYRATWQHPGVPARLWTAEHLLIAAAALLLLARLALRDSLHPARNIE